jgi:hypothetical protein
MPLFSQNIKQFISSKTNWTGLGMIAGAVVGFKTAVLTPYEAVQTAIAGFSLLFIKDAVHKVA